MLRFSSKHIYQAIQCRFRTSTNHKSRNTCKENVIKMSNTRKTKVQLVAENESLLKVLKEIHNLVAPFIGAVDANATVRQNDIATNSDRNRNKSISNLLPIKTEPAPRKSTTSKIPPKKSTLKKSTPKGSTIKVNKQLEKEILNRFALSKSQLQSTYRPLFSPNLTSASTATATITRITPVDIREMNHTQNASRRSLPRKAAPTNLKEYRPSKVNYWRNTLQN